MKKKKDLLKKDWYETLNENLKFLNKDFEDLNSKRKKIMNEQIKLNKIDLIRANLDNKYKSKNENRNPSSETGFLFPEEKKLISNRLNLKNYKTQNYISGNMETLFLKEILEKLDKISFKKEFKFHKKIANRNISRENNNLNNTKSNKLSSQDKNKNSRFQYEDKKLNSKDNLHLLSKTFNGFIKYGKISENSIYFPKIKNKRNKKINSNSRKKELMKILLTEENKTINRGKFISNDILKLNKDFIKNKKQIYGYEDKEDEEYIIINNKKIYQINLDKEINKKLLRKKFLNIKKIKDIEKKLLNDNKTLVESTKKNLLLKYQQKKENNNINFHINNTDEN